jgi:hypothetical protein
MNSGTYKQPTILIRQFRIALLFTLPLLGFFLLGTQHIFFPSNTPGLEWHIYQTSPPPDVAIELSESQLDELQEAYESGFDHPDPEEGDPCTRLQMLPYKKFSTWKKQFQKRGFTMEKIRKMLTKGRRELYTHPEKGVTYTKIFDTRGNWIVIDFVDCILWQVAPYNFK